MEGGDGGGRLLWSRSVRDDVLGLIDGVGVVMM